VYTVHKVGILKQNYSEAELSYRRALEIKERVLGANHQSVALTLENYAQRQTTKVPKLRSLSVNHEDIAFEKMGFSRAWPQSNVIGVTAQVSKRL
jgi:hypothetical protein